MSDPTQFAPSPSGNGWSSDGDRLRALEYRVWEVSQRILMVSADNREIRSELKSQNEKFSKDIQAEREARNQLVFKVLYVLVAGMGGVIFLRLWDLVIGKTV